MKMIFDANKTIDYLKNQLYDTRIAVLRLIANEIYENQIIGNVAELGVYKGEFSKYINGFLYNKKYIINIYRLKVI